MACPLAFLTRELCGSTGEESEASKGVLTGSRDKVVTVEWVRSQE